MNDKELLELAAIAVRYVSNGDGTGSFFAAPNGLWWNPLTDDGDALRLAVKLGLDILTTPTIDSPGNTTVFGPLTLADLSFRCEEEYGDPYAATRRAIVRAAAEIGRAMK
jgi:hypothetical protein